MMCSRLLQDADEWYCEVCTNKLTQYHKQWMCRHSHRTCNSCVVEHELGGAKCPHYPCQATLQRVKFEGNLDNLVYIFLDHSNMWIESQKEASRYYRFKTVEDPRVRLDMDELVELVSSNRHVGDRFLFGSTPHSKGDSVLWRKMKAFGWIVNVAKRSRCSGKEKQVDQSLVVSMTKTVMDINRKTGTIIIISGDADIIPGILACIERGWPCEVWMWSAAISASLYQVQRENSKLLKIISLDTSFENITFVSSTFDPKQLEKQHSRHLLSQAAVIQNIDFEPNKKWQRDLSAFLKWPFEFCRVGIHRRDILLVLVSTQDHDGKNAKDNFDIIFKMLMKMYGERCPVVSYVQYLQLRHKPSTLHPSLSFSNRFGKLRELDEKKPVYGEITHTTSQLPSTSRDSSVSSTCRLTSDYESMSSLSISNSASLVSLCSSGFADEEKDEDETECHTTPESKERLTTYIRKKYLKPFREICKNRGGCHYGNKCRFKHTEDEKKFFSNRRKDTLCWRAETGCHVPGCPFAHVQEEGFCRVCNEWGHLEKSTCRRKVGLFHKLT